MKLDPTSVLAHAGVAASGTSLGMRLLDGRYRVGGMLGRGGMGVVYRAVYERLGREIAVKVIASQASGAARDRLRARFQREARAAAKLHHPNIVTVYDFGTNAELDIDYIVLELLQGEDLATLLERKRRLPVVDALPIPRSDPLAAIFAQM